MDFRIVMGFQQHQHNNKREQLTGLLRPNAYRYDAKPHNDKALATQLTADTKRCTQPQPQVNIGI